MKTFFHRIAAAVAVCLLVPACESHNPNPPCPQNKLLIPQIEENLSPNLAFYKGGTGSIGKGLYIRRGDSANAIYSFSKGAIAGADSRDLSVNQILKITTDGGDKVSVEHTDALDFNSKNFYVIFTRLDIYALDFAERRFCKYHRTWQQYREDSEAGKPHARQ